MASYSDSPSKDLVLPILVQRGLKREMNASLNFTLSTDRGLFKEIVLDYGKCEGGLPVFKVLNAKSNTGSIEFDVVYSEGENGVHHENGMRVRI